MSVTEKTSIDEPALPGFEFQGCGGSSRWNESKNEQYALDEGLPYQTLISSILHKYVSGRLRESAQG
jgi:hypothetical protein